MNDFFKISSSSITTQNNPVFAAKKTVVTYPANVEPKKDTVEVTKKSRLSKKQKTWLKIGAVFATATAAVLTAREVFIQKAKKVFQEAFLRNDINRKETIGILKRYRNVCKIKDKNEYIKALYEEGKNNFGLKGLKLKFSIEDLSSINARGAYYSNGAKLKISKNITRDRALNTLHHELRHAKQHNLMINYSPHEYARSILKSKGKAFESYLNDKSFLDKMCNNYFHDHGVTRKPNSVPQRLEEYVKKLLKAQETYVEGRLVNGKLNKEYYNNFKEVDARKCGESLEKILKWVKFWR